MQDQTRDIGQVSSKVGSQPRTVVIGGGVGGLVAAAVLARAGVDVTVLEAQSYVGGCAGTFFRQRYRFDAGATVASGFGATGAMTKLAGWLGVEFDAVAAEEVMSVHLPQGFSVVVPASRKVWRTRRRERFGPTSEAFWTWQEQTAATAWRFSDRLPPWPAANAGEWLRCVGSALTVASDHPAMLARPGIVLDARRPLAVHLPRNHRDLREFVDGLLLISAQATSERALAVYGAAALDFPWRGVAHLRGGMGGIAETLVEAIRRHGGRVLTRHRARAIVRERGRVLGVEDHEGRRHLADHVVANLTPWNLRALLDPEQGRLPSALVGLDSPERDVDGGWGAFVLHVGIDERVGGPAAPLHHQVHLGGPKGEGNTTFVSISPEWDLGRAPAGKRAVTITTHTKLGPWWELLARDPAAYAFHKASYQDRLLAAAEVAVPGFRRAVDVVFTGTPVTYERYTGRAQGWVGGIPQTRLSNNFATALAPDLHLVGDSVFPGQSTLAVTLSSVRVASSLLERLGLAAPVFVD